MNWSWTLHLVFKSYCQKTPGDLWWRHVTYYTQCTGHWDTSQRMTYWHYLVHILVVCDRFDANPDEFIFPHCFIMGMSQNSSDLRSQISKFRDIRFVGPLTLITYMKLQSDRSKGVARARVWIFWRLGHWTWPGDLTLGDLGLKFSHDVRKIYQNSCAEENLREVSKHPPARRGLTKK